MSFCLRMFCSHSLDDVVELRKHEYGVLCVLTSRASLFACPCVSFLFLMRVTFHLCSKKKLTFALHFACIQILTPSWRVSGSNTPNSGDVSRVSSSSDSSLFAAMMEGAPPPKIDEEGEEDSGVIEVVTDEEYIARHTPCELQEQQRALGIVSETGQRSSVSAGDGEHEARPRDHSKGPSSTLVKLIENRASSVQTNAGFPPRRFPLTDEDLADVQAQLDAPIEVYPLLSDLEAAEEAELATPSVMASSATAEETEDKPEKPIKMIFKMRVVPDDNTQDDDGDDADADDDDDDDDDDDVDGDADADNDGTANAAE